jgi:hypothetical protein
MSRKRKTVIGVALGAVLVASVNVLPTAAQQPPPPIASEFLTGRAVLTDDVAHVTSPSSASPMTLGSRDRTPKRRPSARTRRPVDSRRVGGM